MLTLLSAKLITVSIFRGNNFAGGGLIFKNGQIISSSNLGNSANSTVEFIENIWMHFYDFLDDDIKLKCSNVICWMYVLFPGE